MDLNRCPRCGYRLNIKGRDEMKKDYPNAFQSWKPAEDERLEQVCRGGEETTLLGLARDFGRQPTAILRRIEKLGLPNPFEKPAAAPVAEPHKDEMNRLMEQDATDPRRANLPQL